MKTFFPVDCTMDDCIYYFPPANENRSAFCKHPEIKIYLNSKQCPLYRLDWQKKYQLVSEIIKVNKK